MTDTLRALAPDPLLLIVAVIADLALGDPVYAWHPVRLIGRLLNGLERRLRAVGLDGYGGGVVLFFGLAAASLATLVAVTWIAGAVAAIGAWIAHAMLLYMLLALGDLLHHVRRIESAVRLDDLVAARRAVGELVGRDTNRMDGAACRRAAVESLSESLTDGFVSPVCWYALAGLPGIVLFKIASTMDSMIGYKTPRYLRFGWCGARLDDLMNYAPARLAWIVISCVAFLLPGLSGRKAWRVGLEQHAVLLGPNSGWSEAATAGALARRIVGPLWLNGIQVTDVWVGDPGDPPLATATDVTRAIQLTVAAGASILALVVLLLAASRGTP